MKNHKTPDAPLDIDLYLSENTDRSSPSPNILSRLTHSEYNEVLLHSDPKSYLHGDKVFSQGERHDGIFLIDSGIVRTFYLSSTGREITLAYWGRGNFVGGPEIFGGGEHIWSAVAAQESLIYFLKGRSLRRLVKGIPNLALGIIDGLVHKGKCYSELLQILGTRPAKQRLAHLLATLAYRYGVQTDDGILITKTYTHEELSNMIGATRQWVTKMLEIFSGRGYIVKRGQLLLIRNISRLENLL